MWIEFAKLCAIAAFIIFGLHCVVSIFGFTSSFEKKYNVAFSVIVAVALCWIALLIYIMTTLGNIIADLKTREVFMKIFTKLFTF